MTKVNLNKVLKIFIIIICFIYSPMRFPYGSMQTACHYKENPPVPIWRQKPCEGIGKVPYLELTLRLALRQGKTYILSSIYRGCPCRGLFACLCFTNVSARCNAIKVPVLSALLYIRFLAPFLSFMYHLMYIAPFSLSIAKDHRGVSFTSFKFICFN